jgi:hypothetical protein
MQIKNLYQPILKDHEPVLTISGTEDLISIKLSELSTIYSMFRGQSQFMVIIYFRLFLELDLICHTWK